MSRKCVGDIDARHLRTIVWALSRCEGLKEARGMFDYAKHLVSLPLRFGGSVKDCAQTGERKVSECVSVGQGADG